MIVSPAVDCCADVWGKTVERRQSERLPVAGEVFLAFRPNFDRIGNVKDISKTGICFEYLALDESSADEYVEVDVFSAAEQLYISRIPCRVVYDIRKEAAFILQGAETRRCGLEFRALGEQQADGLSSFFQLQGSSFPV